MLEQELKLTAPDADTLQAVLSAALITDACTETSPASAKHFLAVYYDTDTGTLQRAQCALRARREGERFRAAFKLPGSIVDGLSQREEHETDITDWIAQPSDLPDGILKDKVAEYIALDQKVIEQVRVDMQRTIRWLSYGGAVIELVVDQGLIKGANSDTELYEVELELKEGEVESIVALGKRLAAEFNLVPSTQTKYEIGLSL